MARRVFRRQVARAFVIDRGLDALIRMQYLGYHEGNYEYEVSINENYKLRPILNKAEKSRFFTPRNFFFPAGANTASGSYQGIKNTSRFILM